MRRLRVCLKIRKWAAVRDFGCALLGPASRWLVLLLLGSLSVLAGETVSPGRIIKTLPLLVDTNGYTALSPSLFDRDAYQAYLREHTNDVSAIRFDILWQAKPVASDWKLRLELRGVAVDGTPRRQTLETAIHPPAFRHWDSLTLGGTNYHNFGRVVAWRSTLWQEDVQVSEQQSFLW